MTTPTWATVSTILDTPEATRRFVAHYKTLGASEIFVFLDDPNDPSYDDISKVPGVTAIKCDEAHWTGRIGGPRPAKHQPRQRKNAQWAYSQCTADWIVHLDVDEFLYSPGTIDTILAERPADEPYFRVLPAEPLINMGQGVIAGFRSALPRTNEGREVERTAYGKIAPLLQLGLMSHTIGKFFARTGNPDCKLTVHEPKMTGEKPAEPAACDKSDLLLLHFHMGDEDDWIEKFERRIDGTYSKKWHDDRSKRGTVDGMGLNAYLTNLHQTQGRLGLQHFFRQVAANNKRKKALRSVGCLHKAQLWLDQKHDTVFPDHATGSVTDFTFDDQSGRPSARASFHDVHAQIFPADNYTEAQLAQGNIVEASEIARLIELVRGRRVSFWDVGANFGLYSLVVSRHAGKTSQIKAFEPNPAMAKRLRQNLALNDITNVDIHEVGLGPETGLRTLFLPNNLGQASMVQGSSGTPVDVPVERLADHVGPRRKSDPALRILKIDIEGFEPDVLAPFFATTDSADWFDYILFEHAHVDKWPLPRDQIFDGRIYETAEEWRNNTLLVRKGMQSDAQAKGSSARRAANM